MRKRTFLLKKEQNICIELREFKVKGRHKETNRYRTERIQAISERKCYQVALERGLLEPYEIVGIPPREPTEGQLKYAKKLNLNIPQGVSLNDVSTLIDRAVNGDSSDPNTELIEYANAREMIFSKYIGKKALYDVVFDTLTGKDKITFFLFCVYRWLSDDRFGVNFEILWAEFCELRGRHNEQKVAGTVFVSGQQRALSALLAIPGFLRTRPQNYPDSAHVISKFTHCATRTSYWRLLAQPNSKEPR